MDSVVTKPVASHPRYTVRRSLGVRWARADTRPTGLRARRDRHLPGARNPPVGVVPAWARLFLPLECSARRVRHPGPRAPPAQHHRRSLPLSFSGDPGSRSTRRPPARLTGRTKPWHRRSRYRQSKTANRPLEPAISLSRVLKAMNQLCTYGPTNSGFGHLKNSGFGHCTCPCHDSQIRGGAIGSWGQIRRM